ncbi:MAG: signal recognition particle receptor subunit alpha, partial [bacterium]
MLKSGIFKNLWRNVDALVTGRGRIDDELFEEFEAALLAADVSVTTTDKILDDLREAVRLERLPDAKAVRERLRQSLTEALGEAGDTRLKVAPSGPSLYLMVGVNGVGKTTTLGKMAYRATHTDGKKVMLVAG